MAWAPWRELDAREHITLVRDPVAKLMGGGLYAHRGDRAVIALDPDLGERDQTAVLAHELVHDERRLPTWGVPALLADKEERHVEQIVAQRLVPGDELAALVDRELRLEGGVTAEDVAEAFDVPLAVASRALGLYAMGRWK